MAGEDPPAHSGEEYRQELRKGLERYGARIQELPGGAGSGFRGGAVTGHFYCAKVGDRLFLRFVPANGSVMVKDTLGCLRLIACREDTPCELSEDLANAAYGAWELARRDVFADWMFATDPANLQPRVRPALKATADHLRKFPPRSVTQDELDQLIDSIEAPWGVRIERQIREAMESASGNDASDAITTTIKVLGLQPYRAPEPLPPIEEDEIQLVCWMGVESAASDA